jgi:hypothetical protein
VKSRAKGLAALALAALAAACATTRQTRSVEPSGFLGDYSQLRPGEGEEALLVYVRPGLDLSGYEAVLIDPVTLWQTESTTKLSSEEAQQLTDSLYTKLRESLSRDWRIAEEPGPGVLRVRAALTEAKGARVAGQAVTSVIPQLRLLSTVAGLSTDAQVFVGKAAAEAEITDALTGERLLAAVDERAGTKALGGGFGTWSHVDEAFEYWAERMRTRLAELRSGKQTH